LLDKKVGDHVDASETLATIYASDENKLKAAAERFVKAFSFSDAPVDKPKLIKAII